MRKSARGTFQVFLVFTVRDLFPGYYLPSDEELEKLWKEATIAIDANVLLNLYRYPGQAKDDLLSVLRNVSGRLFVPFQAVLEYQRNRLTVIASQLKRFEDVQKILDGTKSQLENGFAQLQLKKRHASIDPDKLMRDVEELFNSFQKNLELLESKHPDVIGPDEIRNQLDIILNGKIGKPSTKEELEALYVDGKKRQQDSRPPGYLDSSKAKADQPAYTFNGARIDRQYGDLILWKQVVAEAKEKGIKQLIFVTDDEKADWWWIVDSRGKRTIGPRPELIEELRTDASVDSFHMYNSERFLEFGRKFLDVTIQPDSVEQVRTFKRATPVKIPHALRKYARLAVRKWLRTVYPSGQIYHGPGIDSDYLVELEDGSKLSFDVQITHTGYPERLQAKTIALAAKSQPAVRRFIVWVSAMGPFPKRGSDGLRQLDLPGDMHLFYGHLESLEGRLSQKFVLEGEVFPRIHNAN